MRIGFTERTNRGTAARWAAALVLAAAAIPAASAGGTFIKGPFGFDPIETSAVVGSLPQDAPFKLPAGFSQEVLWDEKGLFSSGPDFYATQACVPDMHQSNETGKWAGRFLYRTHEVRSALDRDGNGTPEGPYGSLSVTDLETGETKLLVQRADWE